MAAQDKLGIRDYVPFTERSKPVVRDSHQPPVHYQPNKADATET